MLDEDGSSKYLQYMNVINGSFYYDRMIIIENDQEDPITGHIDIYIKNNNGNKIS